MSTDKKRRGPRCKLTEEQQAELRESFKAVSYGKKGAFYSVHAERLEVHPLTIKRVVGGGGTALTFAQKMELRRDFKDVPKRHGEKGKFYRHHAERLGVASWTIRAAVMG